MTRSVLADDRGEGRDWVDGDVRVLVGDCRERLRELPDASVDALVTDPPAGISFMSAAWDTFPTRPARKTFSDGRDRPAITNGQEHNPRTRDVFEAFLAEVMREALRVAKPGALGLVWSIPRTAHWTADALEEAGWEIHPNGFVAHLFASGFPKAKTHLKPATEVWWLVRKPGPGGLNIEDCRVEGLAEIPGSQGATHHLYGNRLCSEPTQYTRHPAGRWPGNLVLSHAEDCRPAGTRKVASNGHVPARTGQRGVYMAGLDGHEAGERYMGADGTETVEAWDCVEGCPVAELDRQSGVRTSGFMAPGTQREGLGYHGALGTTVRHDTIGDSGGASRFFFVAKASARERSAGLPPGERNTHPTVKPLDLMRWLCRLVTPPGGTVLDPLMGSGTTGCAAALEGFGFVGIEQDPAHARTAVARIRYWAQRGTQGELDVEAPESEPAAAAGPACARCGRSDVRTARYPEGLVCVVCAEAALAGEVG